MDIIGAIDSIFSDELHVPQELLRDGTRITELAEQGVDIHVIHDSISNHLSFRIPDKALDKLKTVGDIRNYLSNRRQSIEKGLLR